MTAHRPAPADASKGQCAIRERGQAHKQCCHRRDASDKASGGSRFEHHNLVQNGHLMRVLRNIRSPGRATKRSAHDVKAD